MRRYPHYWWPLKGSSLPQRIGYLDCDGVAAEATGRDGLTGEQLTAWNLIVSEYRAGMQAGTVRCSGDSAASLWGRLAQLLAGRSKLWLFCGPTGRVLPMIDFWQRLEDRKIVLAGRDWREQSAEDDSGESGDTGVCVLEEPPTVILCQLPDRPGRLLIADIRNYGAETPLPGRDCRERAEHGMSGLGDIVSSLRAHGRTTLRCTASSQAVSSLRSRDECVRLHCHTNVAATALERASYFGGRCEAYRIGELAGPIYHLDVRSMYPSLCLTLPIPTSLRCYHESERDARDAGTRRPECTIAHVQIRSAVPAYPCRRKWGTVYPVGVYDTYLAGPELRQAVAEGRVARWYSAAEYTCAPLLSGLYHDWIERTQAAREAGKAMLVQWCKKVMVGLVGKFGEPGKQWLPCPPLTELGPFGCTIRPGPDGEPVRYRNVGWHTQREVIDGESYWSMPSVASWITSAGRALLNSYLALARMGHVYYVDTDSLICDGEAYSALREAGVIREGEYGYLRLMGTHRTGAIYGFRHYRLDDTVSCAGIPRGDIRPGETRGQYWWRRLGKDEIALGQAPTGREQLIACPPERPYRHGHVGVDGTVTPLVMGPADEA